MLPFSSLAVSRTPALPVLVIAAAAILSGPVAAQASPVKLIPGDVGTFDQAGFSVATVGSAAFLGSPNHDGTGAVNIYQHGVAGWSFAQELQPGDLAAGDQFGFALAASQNLLVVGTPSSGLGAGAVYVFRSEAAGFVQEAKITIPGSSNFGYSVDLDDNKMIVGENGNAAYIYEREAPGDWGDGPLATLLPPMGDLNYEFGESVAIHQSVALVGDSELMLTVGSSDIRPGAAYPFFQIGDVWTPGARIDHPDPQGAAHFGYGIDVYGSFAVIGAYNQTLEGAGEGAEDLDLAGTAYVYVLETGNLWSWHQTLLAPAPLEGDRYGNAVAMQGGRLAIGAPGLGPGGGSASSGAVHLYELQQNGTWLSASSVVPAEIESEDSFGWDVSLSRFVLGGAPFDELIEGGLPDQAGSAYAAPFE